MHESEANGLPVRAALRPDGLYLALRAIAPAQLQDAFMQETVVRLPGRESVVRIAAEDLGKAAPGSAPAGVIFHVARCGSTLVAQLLKQHGGVVVYAEPLPVNEVLLPPHRHPRGELVAALRSLGDAFARHAGRPYVLKLTSWNTFFCDIVAEAFPQTPWILCLRDPIEVCVSLIERPPGWLRNADGPVEPFAGLVDPEHGSASVEEYAARAFGAFCRAAARLDAAHGRVLPYPSLPSAIWETVAPHFGLKVDESCRRRMADAAGGDAKAPLGRAKTYASDVARKQAAATASLRAAIDAFAHAPLAGLERFPGYPSTA